MMYIQLTNLPSGTTTEDIDDLLSHMNIIDHICVANADDPSHIVAWVLLHCSQTGANAISDALDGRVFKGRHVSSYTSLFLH
jgi:hypothetical protein